ncbi:MAG: tRNA (adenosine(37)-N6)-dimethylallyltransferase MiaA [Spirochaetes bacterium]|nr:tRNA (adenosine(37)-N6)-dimethylallyltransferase MiaA [Spirochaetota bacterium]
MKPVRVVFVVGPTASGKSDFVHNLIDTVFPNAVVIGADSMQIYTRMRIGTAKPSPETAARYRYRLVDCVDPTINFSVADYFHAAVKELSALTAQPVFVVGGTGLYVRALKCGMFTETDDGGAIRSRLEQTPPDELPALYERLRTVDPAAAQTISPGDRRRIIRALEVYEKTGEPISVMQQRRSTPVPLTHRTVELCVPRSTLYDRINRRVLSMFGAGLIDEVKSLISYGVTAGNTAMQGIGYKEVVSHLSGALPYDELITTVQQNTRRYAKRQETWFRREDPVIIDPENIMEKTAIISKIAAFFGGSDDAF